MTLFAASERADPYAALLGLGHDLHAPSADVQAALELVVEQAQTLLAADLAWLVLTDESGRFLRPAVLRGFRDLAFLHARLPIGDGVGGQAIDRRTPLVVADYRRHLHRTTSDVRERVLAEGVAALVCAPMMHEAQVIGTLYAASRRPAQFDAEQAQVLGALAEQASAAIEQRRSFRRITSENRRYARSLDHHRQLVQVSVRDGGLDGLAALLSAWLGRPTTIASWPAEEPADGDDDDGDGPALRRAISAPCGRLGTLTIGGGERLDPDQEAVVEQALPLLTLELLKREAADDGEWRARGALLEALLDAGPSPPPELARRAARLRVDLDAAHCVVALDVDGDDEAPAQVLRAARSLLARQAPGQGGPALTLRDGRTVLIALPPTLTADPAATAATLRDAATSQAGAEVVCGVGPVTRDVAASARAARACAAFAAVGGGERLVDYERLGPLRFLLDARDPRHALASAEAILAPLVAHDAQHRTPLVATARALAACGGHQTRTADRCFVAVSTLKYRLRKIETLLGVSPNDPETLFRLTLAFRIRDLLRPGGAASGQEWADR
ncbi:helix-turn-helix domain-containing protein [Patulibacter defluvii]|uniref:helix-turn-helix domain-containing protein n=1 Tax=Patulibacter defluvii TaxID=3095358 RepID=UPI002A75BCEA|nr:GAF domain-containing protein [Patulibacter sp. DM4]